MGNKKGHHDAQSLPEMLDSMSEAKEQALSPRRGQSIYKKESGEYQEEKLKDLLESRDPELLDYLTSVGINFTDADIKAVIARIESKHNEGKTATANAVSLKNQNVYNILVKGQAYITEVAKNSNMTI